MSPVPPIKMHLHTVQQQLFLDDYYGWFYGWAKVPADTYKADLALLAWLHAELSWKFHEYRHPGGDGLPNATLSAHFHRRKQR